MKLNTLLKQITIYSTAYGWRLYATCYASQKLKAYIKNRNLDNTQFLSDSVYHLILNNFYDFLDDDGINYLYDKIDNLENE